MKSSSDGVFPTTTRGVGRVFFYRIGRLKSKNFTNKRECATEFVTKYIDYHPEYKQLVLDKTWDDIFRIFGIAL